mmetsp:Transcript_1915/g.4310  ORF Transcript_1915/g.4310 Transcript_1915/m.4310 type:complete len:370 (-) Transcript_1915:38-1147(-)
MRIFSAVLATTRAVNPEASLLHEEFLSCQGSWHGSIPFPHVVGKGVVSGVSLEVSYDTCDAVKHFQLGQDPCSGDKPAAMVRGALISKSSWVPKSTWDLYKSTFDCDKPRVTGVCDKIIGLPVCFLAVQLNTTKDKIAVEVAACVDRHAKMCSPWATVWTRTRKEAAEGEDHAQATQPEPTPKPWSREDAGEDALDNEIEPPEGVPPPEVAQKIRGLVEAIRLLQEEKDVWEAGWRVGYDAGKNDSSTKAAVANATRAATEPSAAAAQGVGPGEDAVADGGAEGAGDAPVAEQAGAEPATEEQGEQDMGESGASDGSPGAGDDGPRDAVAEPGMRAEGGAGEAGESTENEGEHGEDGHLQADSGAASVS